MVELPGRFLTAGTDHEDGRRKEVGGLQRLNALANDAVSELLQPIELGTLRKAANIVNVLHVMPALLNLGHCGHAALREILPASGRAANNFFAPEPKAVENAGEVRETVQAPNWLCTACAFPDSVPIS